jgi:nucleoside-diphosphate-sugar epimerase
VAEIAEIVWEAAGREPAEFELKHLPSFEVDVQRRWPSVEKARRLLGWEAQINLRDGVAQTAAWLRTRRPDEKAVAAAPTVRAAPDAGLPLQNPEFGTS